MTKEEAKKEIDSIMNEMRLAHMRMRVELAKGIKRESPPEMDPALVERLAKAQAVLAG